MHTIATNRTPNRTVPPASSKEAAGGCCGATERETCCQPSEKAGCCGSQTKASPGCGCR